MKGPWLRLLALAWTLLLAPVSSLRECERERLESTKMALRGEKSHNAARLKEAGIDGIYIVHYTRYTERWIHMMKFLTDNGLQAYFVNGWDREDAVDEDVKCMYTSNALFQKVAILRHFDSSWFEVREMTLAMKHAAAWYQAFKNGHRNILVVEDDAMFEHNWIDTVVDILTTNTTSRGNFDIFLLGSFGPDPRNKEPYFGFDKTNRGGVAYILTQSGVQHLMSQDVLLRGTADHMLTNGGTYPNAPPRRMVIRPWIAWQGTRIRNPPFHMWRNAINPTWCWTPDMGPCIGRWCPLSPKFSGDYMVTEGMVPTYASIMYENGTVASRKRSQQLAMLGSGNGLEN